MSSIQTSRCRTYVLLVTAMVFYGMSFISTKIVLDVLGPIGILLVRISISALILITETTINDVPENDDAAAAMAGMGGGMGGGMGMM